MDLSALISGVIAIGAQARPRDRRFRIRARFSLGSAGQALVELALIAPILLLLFAAALDLGRLYYSEITIANAAQQAALEASSDAAHGAISYQPNQPCNSTTNRVVCRAVNESKGSFIAVAPADVSLACSTTPCPPSTPALGNTVAVTVHGHFSLVTPLLSVFFGGQNITLSSTATAQMIVAPVGAVATPTPTPTPSPTPSPSPSASASPSPSPSPTPTPTPVCFAPAGGPITVTPTSGNASNGNNATVFTFSSSSVTNMNTPGCGPVYSWNFGDGSGTSSLAAPTHSYGNSWSGHTVTVTLVASNSAGSHTYTLTILLT